MRRINYVFSKLKSILIPLYVVLFCMALYHVIFAQRIVPGVSVGNISLGGKTFSQAVSELKTREADIPSDLTLIYKEEQFLISKQEINLKYNWDETVRRAFEVGRTGNVIIDSKDKIAGVFKKLPIIAKYEIDEQLLSNKLSMVKAEIYVEPKESDVQLVEGKLVLTDEQTGLIVDEEKVYNNVVASIGSLSYEPIYVPVDPDDPVILKNELAELLPQIEKMVTHGITIKFEPPESKDKTTSKAFSKEWKIEKEQILDFLTFKKSKDTSNEGELEIKIYNPKYESFMETISTDVNQLPKGKVTETDGEKVTKFEIIQSGYEVDVKKFAEIFNEALFNGETEAKLVIKEIGTADKDTYGIYALLGEGKSTFKNSIRGRINNLTLAASRTDGVLVPPGSTYSMNNTIGEISGRTGYDTAYIIQNGRTVLGEGGGVCQTSTTLFRAVLDSGLPILMRYPHAYRVAYYEQDSKPGIDASIFQPSLDFKFKNDTQNYVLIQTNWDLESSTLFFKLYGTPDGRVVEMTEPTLTNVTPAPATEYIDDPTLAKGTMRQIDWSAPGGTASFTRVVKRDGEVLYDDNFTTRYQPWRAIFLRGTKE